MTLIACCVRILWNLANGKSVKSCVAYLTKKNKISPGSPAIATARIGPKICQRQPPTMYPECSRFHPNLFTFGGVIAERVYTAKTCRKVNQIFGWSMLSSSRIITSLSTYAYYKTLGVTHRASLISLRQPSLLFHIFVYSAHTSASRTLKKGLYNRSVSISVVF